MRGELLSALASGVLIQTAGWAAQPPVIASGPLADMPAAEVTLLLMSCSIAKKVDEERLLAWSRYAPDDPRAGKALAPLIMNDCMPVDRSGHTYSLKFNRQSARAALYEALYKKTFRMTTTPMLSTIVQPDFSAEFIDSDATSAAVAVRAFGDCLAVTYAPLAHRLLQTEIGSKGEAAALVTLAPLLGVCLAQGSQLKLGKVFIRGMLAEAMYKRAANLLHASPKSAGKH